MYQVKEGLMLLDAAELFHLLLQLLYLIPKRIQQEAPLTPQAVYNLQGSAYFFKNKVAGTYLHERTLLQIPKYLSAFLAHAPNHRGRVGRL